MTVLPVEIAIIIATRNGERVLRRTLDGYCGVIRPSVSWKIIVADDGSMDATLEIAQSYSRHLPLELLSLPARGKSHALNCAIKSAVAKYIIFADDDTIPNMYFLLTWQEAFAARTAYGLFGGSIELSFEAPPPEWLIDAMDKLGPVLGARQLSEGPIQWDDIFGGNMAVRREILDRGFRFDEAIGPGTGSGYVSGEDSEFCRRVAQSGVKCWFSKTSIVQHIVRPYQLTQEAWAMRAYRTGRGRAYLMSQGGTIETPRLSWTERLKLLSPLVRQRYESLLAFHLSRGFDDEWKRSSVRSVR